ncbi:MAG: hypothetical protein KC503_10535 [Myxococcales bacterium]|nr:hypothetical protein [Myxococcales bacterium]
MGGEQATLERRSRRLFRGGLLAVVALHVTLALYFVPPSVVFSKKPIYDIDYALHWYHVERALESWRGAHKLWSYDPHVLAGHAAGALEDVSFKAVELWVIALRAVNVHPAVAFNLFALLVHLLVPLLAYLVGHLFRLERRQRLVLVVLWSMLWYFDSFVHWVWFCGMISWALASQLGIVALGLLYRSLEEKTKKRYIIGLALVTSFLALHHPFIALSIAAPALAIYIRDARRLGLRRHAALVGCLALSVLATMVWLPTAMKFAHYMLKEDSFLRPTIDYFLYDLFDLTRSPDQTGPTTRTMWRVLVLAAGSVCLWRWWRAGRTAASAAAAAEARDRRTLLFFALGASTLLLAYTGSVLYVTRVTQPYRHIVPMALGMAVPAAVLLGDLLRPTQLRGLSRPAKLLLVFAVLMVLPRFVRNVLLFMPSIEISKRDTDQMRSRHSRLRLAGYFDSPTYEMRQRKPPKYAYRLRRWLNRHVGQSGRVVVEDYMLGEFLAATSKIPVLGGLKQRSFHHGDAHLFRVDPGGVLPGKQLESYLERYAVRYVVMTKLYKQLEWRKDMLKFRKAFDRGRTRVYETRIKPDYFKRGKGRIISQTLNRIDGEVFAGDDGKLPASVELRFHWMGTLRCLPACRIERVPDNDDRVGFIRVVPARPRFTIYNGYDLSKRP